MEMFAVKNVMKLDVDPRKQIKRIPEKKYKIIRVNSEKTVYIFCKVELHSQMPEL